MDEVKLLPCADLSDDKCAICGKHKSRHSTGSGYGVCQIYPIFVSEREMLERLTRPTTVVTDEVVERDDVWWMIERNDLSAKTYIGGCQTMYLCWLHEPGSKHFPRGQHSWTPDWQRGARFATKEEAEAHTNGDPLLRVCEHALASMPTVVTGEQPLQSLDVNPATHQRNHSSVFPPFG